MAALSAFFEPELRASRGLAPLWSVFWGHGVAVSLILLAFLTTQLSGESLIGQQAAIVCLAAYMSLVLPAIWRCAGNASPFWGTIARLLTIAWGINTVSL